MEQEQQKFYYGESSNKESETFFIPDFKEKSQEGKELDHRVKTRSKDQVVYSQKDIERYGFCINYQKKV
jgi:hypothetical protein